MSYSISYLHRRLTAANWVLVEKRPIAVDCFFRTYLQRGVRLEVIDDGSRTAEQVYLYRNDGCYSFNWSGPVNGCDLESIVERLA